MNDLIKETQELKKMAQDALALADADRQRLARQEAGVIKMHTEPKENAAPTETKVEKPVSLKRVIEATEEEIRILKARRGHVERIIAEHESHLKSLHEELLADELKALLDECKDTENDDERLLILTRLVRSYMSSDFQNQIYSLITFALEFDSDDYESDSNCIVRATYETLGEKRVRVILDNGDVFPEGRKKDATGFNLLTLHPRTWDF